jgi:alkylation response protein AidB-like acyl-CoA dehydrogenase
VTVETVRRWLADGALDLPLPASGATAQRWGRLAGLAETDLVAARIAEAHTDAVAILHELGAKPAPPDQLWGVWAAESSDQVVTASTDGDNVTLSGVKPWCSGAGFCDHALVTARRPDGERALYAVSLTEPFTRPLPSTWANMGMSGSDTRSVQFTEAPAVAVGAPGAYLSRPGFWYGAIGVAACWLGGARAVAAPLYEKAGDDHALAHLGAVDAALTAAAAAVLETAAAQIDAVGQRPDAELLARRARAVVEHAVDETLTRTGRALGPGPLCGDAGHAQRVADLTVYVRQSHAERDLAELGRLAVRR